MPVSPTPLESFLSGSVAGMCAISVCHPFDVIRTNLQVNRSTKLSSLRAVLMVVEKRGLHALYDGFCLPFFAQSVYKAVIFSTNTFSSTYIFRGKKGSPICTFLSGSLAGVVNSLLVAPVEIIRTRQIIGSNSESSAISVLSSARKIYLEFGITGFWRGFVPTALRDGPGIGFYLLAFDYTKRILTDKEPPSFGVRLLSGSLAGVSFWIW